MGGSCHRPKLSMRCQSPANIGDWRSGGHGCISRELIPYPGILIQCHLLVNFISNAPYPWWPTMWSMDCQEHSESGKVRSHLGEGFLTNLISSPVGNAGCRDGFRASGHNCHRVVVKVVVPVFSADIFPVKSAFYLINLIIDCSSTTVSWSLAMIKARGVLSYENQLPYLKIIFYSN